MAFAILKSKKWVFIGIALLALLASACGGVTPTPSEDPVPRDELELDLTNDWYVATWGDDDNSCTYPDEPCATITGALQKASDWDEIFVAPGRYPEVYPPGPIYELIGLLIDKDIRIYGQGIRPEETIIDGEDTYLSVAIRDGATVLLRNLTIENSGDRFGHGIMATATELYLDNLIVRNNEGNGASISSDTTRITDVQILNNGGRGISIGANDGEIRDVVIDGNEGGGIEFSINGGVYNVINSTIANNTAEFGSGLLSRGDAEVTILNNTIHSNHTTDGGGSGIHFQGFEGWLRVVNSTISGNTGGTGVLITSGTELNMLYSTIARNDGGLFVWVDSPGTLENTLMVENNGDDCDVRSTVLSQPGGIAFQTGFAFCGYISTFVPRGIEIGPDALIGPLADNGGPTMTHELLAGSPAIDAALGCIDADQRGVGRPIGGDCDIGAYETSAMAITSGEGEGLVEIFTPTPGDPASFKLDTDANCRRGDSTSYGVVTSFSKGESFPIDGRNATTTWFWVLMPQGGHCWLAGSTGTASGPYDAVSIIALPTATPTQPSGGGDGNGDGDGGQPSSPPAAPSSLSANEGACSANGYQVSLSWTDNSDNESGFRIYHNGQEIATVGANTTQYTHNVPGNWGQQQNYYVEAYNNAGYAKSNDASENGCVY